MRQTLLVAAGLVCAASPNRVNAATGQVTGEWVREWISRPESAREAA